MLQFVHLQDIPIARLCDDTEESEVTAYVNSTVAPQSCTNILKWWKGNSGKYPALSRVARNILCIMSTSAPSEDNFSLAGHVVSSRRTRLNGSSVNDILFLNSALNCANPINE